LLTWNELTITTGLLKRGAKLRLFIHCFWQLAESLAVYVIPKSNCFVRKFTTLAFRFSRKQCTSQFITISQLF